MLDLASYSLWTGVLFLAYLHCPFLQRTGRVAWAVACALYALVQVSIRHQVCRVRCTYYKWVHKPVECAADPKNKPAPNVVMRRAGGGEQRRIIMEEVQPLEVEQ